MVLNILVKTIRIKKLNYKFILTNNYHDCARGHQALTKGKT